MAVYNTYSDAANTAVRAFLTKVGEFYLQKTHGPGQSFNTGSGTGKELWRRIKEDEFKSCCAFCGRNEEVVKGGRLEIDHLVMFNRAQYGLHHPGNTVPICKECNTRKKEDGRHVGWRRQLELICEERSEPELFNSRLKRIESHIKEYNYPDLSLQEKHAIQVMASSLSDSIKAEGEKALKLYQELDRAFVGGEMGEEGG